MDLVQPSVDCSSHFERVLSREYETKWKIFLSPFLPAHENLRAITSGGHGEHGSICMNPGTKYFATSTI
jgi:hypothetical protein